MNKSTDIWAIYTYIISDTQVYDSVMADVMKQIAKKDRRQKLST